MPEATSLPLRGVAPRAASMAPAQADYRRFVVSAALLTCMCSPLMFAAASDASTGETLDQDTAVEGVTPVDCDAVVDTFLTRRSKMPKLTPESHNHMLYFLHIPRTAGRTYHACFLKCALSHQPVNITTVFSLRCKPVFLVSP